MREPAGTPSSRVDFGRVAEDYEVTRGIPDELMKEIVRDIIHTCELKSSNLVLELGCGAGRFLRALASQKIQVIGFDISRGMLERACSNQGSSKFLRSNLVFGDAASLPLSNGMFKAVLAIHLFHLMTDWSKALKEVRHILGSEGTIITGYVGAITHQSYLNKLYRQRRKELGYGVSSLGADPDEVIVELQRLGASVETHNFETFVKVPLGVTLSYLDRRVFSSMWRNLPDVVHRQIMQEVRAAATTQFKDLDDLERIEITAQLHFVKFE
ncbi:MAG: class I SAM-dependent methyltransferase [Candidatus Thorarchaeota archaeon]